MGDLERLLRNGGDLEDRFAVLARWAVAHDTVITERWENQWKHNERTRDAHCGLEISVNEIKIKVAVFAVIGTLLGSIFGSVISAAIVYAFIK